VRRPAVAEEHVGLPVPGGDVLVGVGGGHPRNLSAGAQRSR
jgi:hypothetical protein